MPTDRANRTGNARLTAGCLAFAGALAALLVCGNAHADERYGVSPEWQKRVESLTWVCYTPTNANPDRGIHPSVESIQADLAILRRAGFTGLVTYGVGGRVGRQTVSRAESAGFKGVIIGVWDPASEAEVATAAELARNPVVLGICVGNEGYEKRYDLGVLRGAIDKLREQTGKPVATTEEIDDYMDETLLALGDWVFPNSHPYFHGRHDWAAAVRWTQGAYDELVRRSGRFVWFKELGLPTAGDKAGTMSETEQERYYRTLADTDVVFAYFEAFDQPWKDWRPFEKHWGVFTAKREPKQIARAFLQNGPFKRTRGDKRAAMTQPAGPTGQRPDADPFYVYHDADDPQDHYAPTGRDGDCGDIHLTTDWAENPYRGASCLKIEYRTEGAGPHKCAYGPPCRWAALRWLHPNGNWGKQKRHAGQGFDLSRFDRLVFHARAETPCRVRFLIGGVDGPYGDSLAYPRSILADLDTNWRECEIPLDGLDLRHVISGFGWDTNWDTNPDGVTIYLDEIRFERSVSDTQPARRAQP